jgi:C1A family cysteine protease
MKRKHLGWVRPNTFQQIRALRGAHPEAGTSILSGITADPTSDLSALTCNLDQLAIGSCQSNAPAQAMFVAMMVAGVPAFILSRLWLYFGIRWIEGSVNDDAGGNIGDAYRILSDMGVPPETAWPYDISKFKDRPGPEVDREAFDGKGAVGLNYYPIGSQRDTLISDVEKALTAKMAVVFGCEVSEAFCSTIPSGTIHTPGPKDAIAGGHALTVVGHDRAGKRFIVKNSWGDWRDPSAPEGCFFMGYDYFADSTWGASDCWIVKVLPKGITP